MQKNKTEIEVFRSDRFGEVRTIMLAGEPWFVAADVCAALEIANGRAAVKRLDNDERNTVVISDGIRGNPRKVILNEAGLYSLVLTSRKPEAKEFKRWITHEVIPSIRKTGGYMTESLLQQVRKEPALILEFAKAVTEQKSRADALEVRLIAAQPKAEYYDAFISPGDGTNIRTTAKELQIPERRFVRFLLEEHFVFRTEAGYLLPYNRPDNDGLFIVRDFRRAENGFFGTQIYFTPHGKEIVRRRYFARLAEEETVSLPAPQPQIAG